MDVNKYQELAQAIIDKQSTILGVDVAFDRARRVNGLEIDDSGHVASLSKDGSEMLKSLVESYKQLLGPVGITFAKDAIKDVAKHNPSLALPEILR